MIMLNKEFSLSWSFIVLFEKLTATVVFNFTRCHLKTIDNCHVKIINIQYPKELTMFTYNLWKGCLQPDTKSIIVSSYQHCDEQQFQTLTCALYTIIPVLKLDLVIQELLLDYILALKKNTRTACVHLDFI